VSSSQNVTVEEVMSTPLETISAEATVEEAAQLMGEKDINAIVVSTTPPSIISSTDVLTAVADGRDASELQVGDVMTTEVETASPDNDMAEAASIMTAHDIKHLPIVDDDYVGMISTTDIAAHALLNVDSIYGLDG
jgi:CBS domain-containing protein